ncbi:TPM domain-containing protein [Anaerophaga thermohalophila]|jgi:uncharacterized protein|uniref:TPM domain-containing protein n=1 Tax=Anaerophaga thermohalophila TaxID=177400 RepID=UPI0003104066|nr:TPM domain-containing protein [Anaerophaga thermohalophila]
MIRLSAIFIFLVLVVSGMAGQEFPERPEPPRLVNDLAGVLDPAVESTFEQELVSFARQTSTQIAVVTISDLGGYDAAGYAFQLAEQWGIGQSDKDNGILILVQPKTSEQRGQAFIATGYGLEGVVPDAVANRIVDQEMIPRFKNNDYAGGIAAGVSVLMELTRGEYTADKYMERTDSSGGLFGGLGIIVILFIIFLTSIGRQKGRHSSIGHDLPFWVLLSMLGSGHRSHSGSWGSFSSGTGSFGGGSGGGFGGFGGGSFGGGGAGGSW